MNEIVSSVTQYANMGISFLQSTIVLTVIIGCGVILGVFGLKLSRIWSAFIGFVLGIGVGSLIVMAASLSEMASLGVLLGFAVVLAVVFCIFYKIGMFFYLIAVTTGLAALLAGSTAILVIGVGALIGLIFAILSTKWFDPIVIIVTSLEGAIAAGGAIVRLLRLNQLLPAQIGIPAVLFLVFLLIQFYMRSRQVGKEQAKHAKEHKAKTSRENEVERARNILDLEDLDDMDDFDDFDDDYDEDDYDDEESYYDFDGEVMDDEEPEYYDDDQDDEYFDGEESEEDEFEEYEDMENLEDDGDFTIL